MNEPLEEYLKNAKIKPRGLAQMIGKTRQTIENWLEEGGYNVDYDGRTNTINWITRPGRLVYIKGRERSRDE